MIFIELAILFLTSFLAGSFVPFSSEAHLFYLKSQSYNIYFLLLIASIGNTIGGMTCYIVVRYGGVPFAKKYLRIQEERLLKWRSKVEGRGEIFALFCWTPLIGEVIAAALGAVSKKWKKILLYMFFGKTARYVVLVYLFDVIGKLNS